VPLRSASADTGGALRRLHLRIGLIVLISLLPASGLLATLDLEAQLMLVAVPIAVLGVMHGALDPWVGDIVVKDLFGRRDRSMFILAYLLLMLIVIASWIHAPMQTLVVFLLLSAMHFGQQDAFAFAGRADGLTIALFGAVPVLGPVAANPGEVAILFSWLTGMDREILPGQLRWIARPLITLWIVGAGMFLARGLLEQDRNLRFQLAGLGVLAVSMLMLPPLIAFAAYFCLLHSFGHLLDMAASASGPWRDWTPQTWAARLWPATLGALLLGMLGWSILSGLTTGEVMAREALARTIFCGLAALTVPHVALHTLLKGAPGG